MSADPGPDRPATADHGAAAERTRLAWRRTGLSATAVGLLAARRDTDLDAARKTLHGAAERAGLTDAEMARVIIEWTVQ